MACAVDEKLDPTKLADKNVMAERSRNLRYKIPRTAMLVQLKHLEKMLSPSKHRHLGLQGSSEICDEKFDSRVNDKDVMSDFRLLCLIVPLQSILRLARQELAAHSCGRNLHSHQITLSW